MTDRSRVPGIDWDVVDDLVNDGWSEEAAIRFASPAEQTAPPPKPSDAWQANQRDPRWSAGPEFKGDHSGSRRHDILADKAPHLIGPPAVPPHIEAEKAAVMSANRYEIFVRIGPCEEAEQEAAMDAIANLPEVRAVGGAVSSGAADKTVAHEHIAQRDQAVKLLRAIVKAERLERLPGDHPVTVVLALGVDEFLSSLTATEDSR